MKLFKIKAFTSIGVIQKEEAYENWRAARKSISHQVKQKGGVLGKLQIDTLCSTTDENL